MFIVEYFQYIYLQSCRRIIFIFDGFNEDCVYVSKLCRYQKYRLDQVEIWHICTLWPKEFNQMEDMAEWSSGFEILAPLALVAVSRYGRYILKQQPYHFSWVLEVLRDFSCVPYLSGDILWLVCPPDLFPCDYFHWGYMKAQVFKYRLQTIWKILTVMTMQ